MVVEGMGVQHTKLVRWSKDQSEEEIQDSLTGIKYRDNEKMQAAIEADFTYLEVPYSDLEKIDWHYLLDLYLTQR
jgi:hypothetical protein